MKKIISMVVMSLIAWCSYAQSVTVRSDRAQNIDFDKYKTFGWASQVSDQLNAGVYFLNDLILKGEVRDAVKGELMGRGYEINEEAPDLVVNFRVFDKPVRIHNMEGYGTGYWGNSSYSDIADTTSYDVKAGTLIVSLADRKSGRVVWNGFASGLIDNNTFIKDEVKIREAVNMIFDEFDQRAHEYTRK